MTRAIREIKVKTWPDFLQPQFDGDKPFDVRLNDRGYQRDDVLIQEEFDPNKDGHGVGGFTGRWLRSTITYVQNWNLPPGHVALGLREIDRQDVAS